MNLPNELHMHLVTEYRFVANKIKEEAAPLRKIYYFSAMFTEISRILNWHWDRDLVLLHWVLQETHRQLVPRAQPSTPASNMELASRLMLPLERTTEALAQFMEQGAEGDEFYNLIGQIAEIGYLATQHGTWVLEKGIFTLEDAIDTK